MYLSELNIGEKKNFLELAHYTMGLNGSHKFEEQQVLSAFEQECQLKGYKPQKQNEIDNVIKVISKASCRTRKIYVIELFGIMLADGNVCEDESNFMTELGKHFDIDEYELRKIKRWVINMNELVLEGYQILKKEVIC
ncbi:TerB family tellurite resistance protein [Thalassotalea aquiviva]|uniref:TerB family tellurite resistance protein n=1 Tax=Thalassotalea aquiviva TaxID=3242415 RepID=UPI00352A1D73